VAFFKWLKKPKDEKRVLYESKLTMVNPKENNQPLFQTGKYIEWVKLPLFQKTGSFQLKMVDIDNWESIFTTDKKIDKYPNFSLRSREKINLCFHSNFNFFVFEKSNVLHIVHSQGIKTISIGENLPFPMFISKTGDKGALLRADSHIGYLDFQTGVVSLFRFNWQPFTSTIGNQYWLVGTRETYEGPGELYCFNPQGNYQWGIRFKEEFQTIFGPIKATAYYLSMSEDQEDILVSTMDRIYRFLPNGKLVTRIVLAELREQEIKRNELGQLESQMKNISSKDDLVKAVAADVAYQVIGGMMRAATLNDPLAGYAYDVQKKCFYILEDSGRITAWNAQGQMLWMHSLNESSDFIAWLDRLLLVSTKNGSVSWLDEDGKLLRSVSFPDGIESFFSTFKKDRYLVVCKNNRLYEFNNQTGEIIQGFEGNNRMKLFLFLNKLFFYDGKYLWGAPTKEDWKTVSPTYIDQAKPIAELSSGITTPQAKPVNPFKPVWIYKDQDNNPISHFAFDPKNKRLYIGRRKTSLSVEEKHQEEIALQKNDSFSIWNKVACYDFSLRLLWSRSFFSEITMLELSPRGDIVFVGLWEHGLAYDPGRIIIMDDLGEVISNVKTPANPVYIHFQNPNLALLEVYDGPECKLITSNRRNWKLKKCSIIDKPEDGVDFGAGLNEATIGSYVFKRTGKKVYKVFHGSNEVDLKLSAAIYELVEYLDSENILLLIGKKTIRSLSTQLEILWETKVKVNIEKIVAGFNGFLILSREEILFIDLNGQMKWSLGCPFNSYKNNAQWIKRLGLFLWEAGNNNEFQLSLITPEGQVVRCQSFKNVSTRRGIEITEDEKYIILPLCYSIECFELNL